MTYESEEKPWDCKAGVSNALTDSYLLDCSFQAWNDQTLEGIFTQDWCYEKLCRMTKKFHSKAQPIIMTNFKLFIVNEKLM